MFIKQTCAALVTASLIGLADAASADDKQTECTTYATMATNQAVMAKHLKCGYSGQRWTTDNKDHFSWCMELTDPYSARIAKERAEQMKELSKCVREHARSKPNAHG